MGDYCKVIREEEKHTFKIRGSKRTIEPVVFDVKEVIFKDIKEEDIKNEIELSCRTLVGLKNKIKCSDNSIAKIFYFSISDELAEEIGLDLPIKG